MSDSIIKEAPVVEHIATAMNLHRRHVAALLREITGTIAGWVAEDEVVILRGVGSFRKRVYSFDSGKMLYGNGHRVSIFYKPSSRFFLKGDDNK